MRAYRFSELAGRTAYNWNNVSDMIEQVEREWLGVKAVLDSGDSDHLKPEFGNFLFVIVNAARFLNLHPETELSAALKQFEKRFQHLEKLISARSGNIDSFSTDELKAMWEDVKKR
jgi:uncharacterized protein YabN with tetrapyrrole methylase and pyrophosphatase domain